MELQVEQRLRLRQLTRGPDHAGRSSWSSWWRGRLRERTRSTYSPPMWPSRSYRDGPGTPDFCPFVVHARYKPKRKSLWCKESTYTTRPFWDHEAELHFAVVTAFCHAAGHS